MSSDPVISHSAAVRGRSLLAAGLVLGLLVISGCGSAPDEDLPPRSTVTGTVTLDGQPLEGASVMFTPQEGGALSTGTTDETGKYKLSYGPSEEGAAIGRHKVRISKHGEGDDTNDSVPEKYNAATILEEEVTDGENVINFDLKTTE